MISVQLFIGHKIYFPLIACAEEKMKIGKEKNITISDSLGFMQNTLCLGTFICSIFGYYSFF